MENYHSHSIEIEFSSFFRIRLTEVEILGRYLEISSGFSIPNELTCSDNDRKAAPWVDFNSVCEITRDGEWGQISKRLFFKSFSSERSIFLRLHPCGILRFHGMDSIHSRCPGFLNHLALSLVSLLKAIRCVKHEYAWHMGGINSWVKWASWREWPFMLIVFF
jgi:hypothetical protein